MKKNLLFIGLFYAGIAGSGQPSIQVYGFQQQSLPGTIPTGLKDENGNPVKKAAAKVNYLIFLSFKKNSSITPSIVFVNGSPFKAQTTPVEKTPVEYTNHTIPNQPVAKILVPKTNRKVLRIEPAEKIEENAVDPHLLELAKVNNLVIAYQWKKRNYFVTLKKMNELDPQLNE